MAMVAKGLPLESSIMQKVTGCRILLRWPFRMVHCRSIGSPIGNDGMET